MVSVSQTQSRTEWHVCHRRDRPHRTVGVLPRSALVRQAGSTSCGPVCSLVHSTGCSCSSRWRSGQRPRWPRRRRCRPRTSWNHRGWGLP